MSNSNPKNEISNIKTIISRLEDNVIYDDSFVWQELEDLQDQIGKLPKQDDKKIRELSSLVSNILDNKGSSWSKSKLNKRIEALEAKTTTKVKPKTLSEVKKKKKK